MRRFHFSLSTLLSMVVFLPLSMGVVDTIDVCSANLLSSLGADRINDLSRSLASFFGGLSDSDRVLIIVAGARHLLSGVIIGLVGYLLLKLRSWLFDRMAFSLILSILPWYGFILLEPSLTLTFEVVTAISKALIVPFVIVFALLVLLLIFKQRMEHLSEVRITAHLNVKQWVLRLAVGTIYLSACMYGWSDISAFRNMWRSSRVSLSIIPSAEVGWFALCSAEPMPARRLAAGEDSRVIQVGAQRADFSSSCRCVVVVNPSRSIALR